MCSDFSLKTEAKAREEPGRYTPSMFWGVWDWVQSIVGNLVALLDWSSVATALKSTDRRSTA